jgi:hypothetical protein
MDIEHKSGCPLLHTLVTNKFAWTEKLILISNNKEPMLASDNVENGANANAQAGIQLHKSVIAFR